MGDCREANVELLDDAGVERVEVEQYDVVVVEALFWLQHQTTSVLRLFARRGMFRVLFSVAVFSCRAARLLAAFKLAFVGRNVAGFFECMQQ